MSFWQMFFSVGSFIAYWINFACARNRTNLGHWDWKMVSRPSIPRKILNIALIP
jgi:hypothetical protein